MKLFSILIMVLGELGTGTALFVCLQQTGEIRKSFFAFQSWLVAACFLFMSMVGREERFFHSVYFPVAVFAALAANNFSAERPRWGKGLLFTAAFFGGIFLASQIWGVELQMKSKILALTNVAAGTFLFGWVNGSMILGHWYLIMRGLSFGHFQRATLQLLIAVMVRFLIFGIALLGTFSGNISVERRLGVIDPIFFFMRAVWGWFLPGIFGFMAWRCAQTGSNQAGTGLLYLIEVSVLIGEILVAWLGI